MLRIYGKFFTSLGTLPQMWPRLLSGLAEEQSMGLMINAIKHIEVDSERLEMPSTLAACRTIRNYMVGGGRGMSEIARQITELYTRALDELDGRHLLMLPLSKVASYEKPLDKWQVQVAAFPSTQVDLEEAERCYALGRSTACVFHLMRVLESPLKVLSAELGIVKHAPTWEAYLSVMPKHIMDKFPNKTKAHAEKRSFYSGLEGQLRAIKTAWRNPTMHQIALVYTDDMADELLTLIRGFMREAATELKEGP